jgi:two-component system response regulator HydG
MQKILVIDDDRDLCFLLKQFLSRKGYEVNLIYTGAEALAYLENTKPDLIICDLRLEDVDGITLLGKVKEKYPHLPVIIITGYSDIKTSALALKQGAFDYVVKPLLTEQILSTIQEALNNPKESGTDFIKGYSANQPDSDSFFWGGPDASSKLLRQLKLVAPTEYNVIIYGEDGTGKRSIAYEIHKKSKRAEMPFVVIKSGALSKENPAETLFGYETTDETGAKQISKGLIEEANGGTIFISQAETLPIEIQETLLKFLQKKKMRRIGGTKDINLDLRVFISANKLLWDATRSGKFKEDLYHRLNDFNITIAPLRQRKEDISAFADHFLRINSEAFEKKIKGFSPDALQVIKNYAWLDNIRELKNVIKKAVLLSKTDYIGIESLPVEIMSAGSVKKEKEPGEAV